ncbi:ChbG/HpnK family deacetylase [Silvibacterium sp.]|uniref:ChbG/HpnK family deacetylase n=1 Tax=Silvibacterium sp. TaxID=1964179 RepID=UPI0039E4A9ED
MPRLIINADDFGLTPGINQSVLELSRAKSLTSATLMATATHFPAAAGESLLPTAAGLGVGCHVVLVDGEASLPASETPALAPGGRFHPTLGAFLSKLLRGAISEAEIEIEAVSQIRRLQAAGVRVTHVDTHKHTHMFARVLRPLLRAARACGIRAIRNPFEPDWSVAATHGAPVLRRLQVAILRTQREGFLRAVKQAGLATTDGSLGVLATGTLNTATIESILRAMPEGTWELVTHPAFYDKELDTVATRLRESRPVEHASLLEAIPGIAAERPDLQLMHFGQLGR